MLHLYYLIRDHWIFRRDACQKRIIQRMPKVKILFIHDFGLTIGIVLIFVAMAFWHEKLGMPTSLAVFGLFILITRCCGWALVLICFLLSVIFILTGGELGPNFWSSIKQISAWYMTGYVSGFVFALLYNAFLYISLKLVHCCRKNIFAAVFAYKEVDKVNIIKSPIKKDEVEIPPSRYYKKLYDYNKVEKEQMPHPYTIAFIANPFYKFRKANHPSQFEVKIDPIIHNLDLFIHTIDRALFSFERDSVLGRPEIWSKVKIIAIFPRDFDKEIAENEREEYTLAGRIKEDVQIDFKAVDDLLVIDEDFDEHFKKVLNQLGGNRNFRGKINKKDVSFIDVVYVLSANPDYTRSTALFSDGIIKIPNLSTSYKTVENGNEVERYHENYVKSPGKVALNLLTARQKTFIHEFAHAMSHYHNGAIVDEYFNEIKLINNIIDSSAELNLSNDEISALNNFKDYIHPIFMINKKPLIKAQAILNTFKVHPVPKRFMVYNDVDYFSDRDHPSAEEEWNHYFPLREAMNIGCTMDRTIGQYKFDRLISDYMYDRLIAKINRM